MSLELNERRAKFVYEAARLAAQAAKAPIIPALWDEREYPFKVQFLKIIDRQCSWDRSKSPQDLHESWMKEYFEMGWTRGDAYDKKKKTHPDLIPYKDLGKLEKDKDDVFIVLCEIARQWIYDHEGTYELSERDIV